jgi:hypothetical protein
MSLSLEETNVVPATGLEPAHPAKDFGFKDHCVYQFRHTGTGLIMEKTTMSVNCESGAVNPEVAQIEKFKAAARDLECDEDEARWDAALKKVAKHKPAPEKPE